MAFHPFDVSVPFVLLLALVVRLLSLPLLRRAQGAFRARSSAMVAGTGAGTAGPLPGAVVAELAACAVFGALLVALLTEIPGIGLGLRMPAAFADLSGLQREMHLRNGAAQLELWLVAAPALALWLLLGHLARRRLLTVGMPAAVAEDGRLRRGGLVRFWLLAVLGVAVLPVGVVLAGVAFQAVALVSARRLPALTGPAAVIVFPPRPEPVPAAAPTAPATAPTAPATAPTAPATAPASATPVPPPAPPGPAAVRVPHQPLHGHEPRGIGGYRLLGRIGAGGMGTVYLAQREGAATQVALKTINLDLLDDPDLLRRFRREAEVLAMVPGAYTARVLDTGVDAGRPFLAMELLDGRPLDAHLRELGPLRAPEALRALALALAVALSGVHRLGLVHRDLKPANVMLTSAGPRLLDFGIAALVDGTRLTATGAGPGTLTYMAPEQFGDEPVGTAADVWAWACCVVCAAHGSSPFAATSTGGVIRRIVDTGPEPSALAAVRALDPALAAVVTRALTPDPSDRPTDGAALLALLTDAPQEDVRAEITRGWSTLRR
ncbi:serine/threonine protein kinase [Kitasatospora sp. NA04385]|uniref:serine/threonine-protein kinase n=1 Tax=Kitasatospora sp. NA04385 TaxID=2742135 RepID=UPI0015911FD8|nr:serine/threonine-protein kinase [Kitasatospora sp. NA04385]QKW18961.1 serine/threonine protein kinase [Kitasatospora sp. NA04385]